MESKDITEKELEDIRKVTKTFFEESHQEELYDRINFGYINNNNNQIGCVRKENGWYIYLSDEKNLPSFRGPFQLKTCIYGLLITAGIHLNAIKNSNYRFSIDEKRGLLCDNTFKSEDEIDEFEQKHK